jgi:hypothetical protein
VRKENNMPTEKKQHTLKEITDFFIQHKDEKTIRLVGWDKDAPHMINHIAEFGNPPHCYPRLIAGGKKLAAHIRNYIAMYPDELLSFEIANKFENGGH